MAFLYTEHLAITITRVAKSWSITIVMSLTGFIGIDVVEPKLFSDNKLMALQYGLLLIDGTINEEGYPDMSTAQLWQTLIFTLVFPGKTHIRIHGININNANVSIRWQLTAINHRNKFESKVKIAEKASRLDDEEFLLFLLLVILGDGHINIKRKELELIIGYLKHKLWDDVIKRLKNLGFREIARKHVMAYLVKSSRSTDLACKMLNNQTIKAMIEDLSQLPDAEKLRRLIALSNMRIKPLGKSSIEIVEGIKMTVRVNKNGYVWLRTTRKNYEDAKNIWEKLRRIGCEPGLRNYDSFEIYIDMDEIKKHPELATKVCEMLRKMHEEAVNEGNYKRALWITKALMRLGC